MEGSGGEHDSVGKIKGPVSEDLQSGLENRGITRRTTSDRLKGFAKIAGLGALATAAGIGINTMFNKAQENSISSDFGQPIESAPVDASFIKSDNNHGEAQNPIFRSGPDDDAPQLSEEELKEKGFDPSNTESSVLLVKGDTFSSDSEVGRQIDPNTGKPYGTWAEIVTQDEKTGEINHSGIFTSGNFVEVNRQEENPQE